MNPLVMYLKPCILLLATCIAICLTSFRNRSFGMRRLVDFCTPLLLTGIACFLLSLFAAPFCPPMVIPFPFWIAKSSDDSKEDEEFSTSLLIPGWLP